MPTLSTQAALTEAEDALHALLTGRSARVFVDQNGERVEYTSINRAGLVTYIDSLKALLGVLVDGPGPLKMVF